MQNPFKSNRSKLRPLPVTSEGLDAFVAEVCTEYGFPNTSDTYDVIATMIMHSSQGVTHSSLRYFGDAILNSMAKKAAYDKLKQMNKDRAALEEKQNQAVTHPNVTSNGQA